MNVITAYATLSKLIKTLTGVVTDFSYDEVNDAIKLTTTTGTFSIPTSQVTVSSVKGDPGQDGKSAYEIAKDHGYQGTEADWIKNLGSSFDDSELQTKINNNKTAIDANKSDIADLITDVGTNTTDIATLKNTVKDIGNLSDLTTTAKSNLVAALNELNSKSMESMTYANKKLTITYKDNTTFDIDLSSIITDTNIGELSNVDDTGITDKQTLIFDAASNKYIPGTIDTSQTLKDAKDYTDKQIDAISPADAIQCDEKPVLGTDEVTYKKGGVTETTKNLNTWFYYQDAEGNWQQTIFIDGVEITIAMTGVDLTNYVSKTNDVASTYTGAEVDKDKVVDIAALDALKALINTDLDKKVNITDIVDALTSTSTDKPLSANQGSVIKTELDKKANTTDVDTELAKKINTADIIDNLTSTDTNKPLSAKQGKALDDKKLNKADADKITVINADGVNIKDFILENCTDKNKLHYIISKPNCTDIPKVNTSYFMTIENAGYYTIKVTAKELIGKNNEYVCTYRSDSAKWSDWEKVLSSSDITDTIDINSSDIKIPNVKAIYNDIIEGKVVDQTVIDTYGTEILKYPLGIWRIGDDNIARNFSDLPVKASGRIEITSIDANINKNPWKDNWAYRTYNCETYS